MINTEQSHVTWRKSSRSGPNGGNCVEMAAIGEIVAVRDSKNPDDGHLTFSGTAWSAFLSRLGEADQEGH